MAISRPVVAFALLKECSEVLQTDFLGGIALLVRPLVNDLSGQRFSAETLSERISRTYGLHISPQVLNDFLPRFIAARLVAEQRISNSANEVVFSAVDGVEPIQIGDEEKAFQSVLDNFLAYCRRQLSTYRIELPDEELISALLTRLATFDFRAIEVKPDRTVRDSASSSLILGRTSKEDIEIEETVSHGSKLDILVASFVAHVAESDEASLELLVKVAEGALGAELVFDLQAPKIEPDLSKVTVVLDTPILLSLLDLSDHQHHLYAQDLIHQIKRAGAMPATFRHCIDEAEGVLSAVKTGVSRYGYAYGPAADRLVHSAYRAFFETMIGAVERRLVETDIKVIEPTRAIQHQYFADDLVPELAGKLNFSLLDRRLAKERDAESVAETIRLRAGAHVPLEEITSCKYIFVTSNLKLQY